MPKFSALLFAMVFTVVATAVTKLEFRRRQNLEELAVLRLKVGVLARDSRQDETAEGAESASAKREQEVERSRSVERETAREEVARLERQAIARRAEMRREMQRRRTADAVALAERNGDPDAALAKLEFFKNVGRDTPRAAFQTSVWAALKGEGRSVASDFAVEGRARERAEKLLEGLPRTENQPATPEQLAAWWFASTVLDVPALTIADENAEDATHVTLLVRSGVGNELRVPMQLGPVGWRIVVPEHAMEVVQKKLMDGSPPSPKK